MGGVGEAVHVTDLGDEHRRQRRSDAGQVLDRWIAAVGVQPLGDPRGEARLVAVEDVDELQQRADIRRRRAQWHLRQPLPTGDAEQVRHRDQHAGFGEHRMDLGREGLAGDTTESLKEEHSRAGPGQRAPASVELRNGASAHRIGRRWVRMTTFKPWEYQAEAGFVKGTDLIGYTVVLVDGELRHVEAEYDSRPAYLEVRRRVVAFRPPRDVAGRSSGADRRYGEEGVRRLYEGPRSSTPPGSTRRSPTTSGTIASGLGSYFTGTYMSPGNQM